MGCTYWAIAAVALLLVIVSIIRWFEQTARAVELRLWSRLMLLVALPPSAWLFPSDVSAGRPSPVPPHEPVQGFGLGSGKAPPIPDAPQRPARPRPAADPALAAKLREKMKQQGMLDDG
jgi:hypothetical protein